MLLMGRLLFSVLRGIENMFRKTFNSLQLLAVLIVVILSLPIKAIDFKKGDITEDYYV